MAWETETATDYKNLRDKLLDFITSKGTIAAPVYTGTGNGIISRVASVSKAISETWTLSCSNATKVGVANYGTSVAADSPILHYRFNEGASLGVADYSVPLLAETPIMHWRLDEVSGTLANDGTVNNIDGTIAGTPTMGTSSLLIKDTNKAITLDGVDDEITSSATGLIQITGDISAHCAFNQLDNTGLQPLIVIANVGSTLADNSLLTIKLVNGLFHIEHNYGTNLLETLDTGIAVLEGTTYLLIVTRDVTTNTYKIYLNGIEVYTNSSYTNDPAGGTASYVSVGSSPKEAGFFKGQIDEVALFPSVLSPATVTSLSEDAIGISSNGTTVLDETVNSIDALTTDISSLAGLLSVDTNESFSFNGNTSSVIASANSLYQITGDLSIEAIIKPTGLVGSETILAIGADGTTNDDNYLIKLSLENGYIKIYHEYATGDIEERTTGIKLTTIKYHLVLSRDTLNKTYSLILDGTAIYTFVYLFPPSDGANSFLSIGVDSAGLNLFSGTIDEVAIYSAQMTPATALSHAKDALGHETFTVTGSTSGAQTDGIVGLHYTNAFVGFTIEDGATDFIVTDNFVLTLTAGQLGLEAWKINRQDVDTVYLEGPGLSETDNIYVTIHTYENSGVGYYNWELRANDGYVETADRTLQVNTSPPTYIPLMNQTMPYWFVASGRRFTLVSKTSTNYHCGQAGLFLPFATPTQYPYPMLIGGSSGIQTAIWSDNTYNPVSSSNDPSTLAFWHGTEGSGYLRKTGAEWASIGNQIGSVSGTQQQEMLTHPYNLSNRFIGTEINLTELREGLSGEFPLMPITLINTDNINSDSGIWGEIDGCFYVTGFNNATENIINDGTYDYLVVQNTFKTSEDHYMALRLD